MDTPIFASRTPRDLNHDAEPFVIQGENNTWRTSADYAQSILDWPQVYADRFRVTHLPRPQFDHEQHNPTSGILAYARGRLSEGESYATILWRVDNGGTSGSPHEYVHARRVLRRLAELAAKEAVAC